jgi:hypothetical protein
LRRPALDKLPDEAVDHHGVARVRDVARTLESDQPPTGRLSEDLRSFEELAVVLRAVHRQHGAANLAAELDDLLFAVRDQVLVGQHRLDAPVEAVRNRVLHLFGRVRLRKHFAEEELEKVGVVRPDVVLVELEPPFVAVENLVEHRQGFGSIRMSGRRMRQPGGDAVAADPDEVRRPGLRAVHRGQAILHPRRRRPRRPRPGGVAMSVAAAVVGDDAEVPRQVMDLGLPQARV